MAHITRFTIEGLTGRQEPVSRTLNRDVNVFFGLNGSGKTSLLKILHSAMSGDTEILENISFAKAEVEIFSITDNRSYVLVSEKLTNLPDETLVRPKGVRTRRDKVYSTVQRDIVMSFYEANLHTRKWVWVLKPKRDKEFASSTRWAHIYLPTSRIYLPPRLYNSPASEAVLSEEHLERFYGVALQELWKNYYQEIIKQVSKAQEDGLANILKAILSPHSPARKETKVVDPATAYQRAGAFLKRQGSPTIIGKQANFEKHYLENEQLRSVVSDINEVEQNIEIAMAPRFRLQTLITKMFSGNKIVEFDEKQVVVTSATGESISIGVLSSGEKHLLRIFIEALNAKENSAIIDEPELSLHIDWQRDLIDGLQELNPRAQYIMATHSPEIMANIGDDKIFKI